MFWYGLLETFVKEYGCCRVPITYTTDDGYRLGSWITNQRVTRDKMSIDRRQRLEALSDWSWNVFVDKWEEGFSQLEAFSAREGHCRVPVTYTTDNGYRLGQWVSIQRSYKDKMIPDRRQRLETLRGWAWNAIDERWEEGFSHLKDFSERQHHSRVPKDHKTHTGYPLGNWVGTQRLVTKDPARRKRLEALPGWSWDPYSDQWEEGFHYLKEFSERERHCRVPYGHKTEDGYRLGPWVTRQRQFRNKIDAALQERLEALPGWSWDVLSDQWEEGFSHLKTFSCREGHCRVPTSYRADDGYRLGRWIDTQRRRKDKMDPDRRRRLEALPGWVWKVEK
jgi:Helicase associated domain